MASIQFKMVNGDRHALTIPEGQDQNEVIRNARDDPGQWISVDNNVYIRRASIVSMIVIEDDQPLIASA